MGNTTHHNNKCLPAYLATEAIAESHLISVDQIRKSSRMCTKTLNGVCTEEQFSLQKVKLYKWRGISAGNIWECNVNGTRWIIKIISHTSSSHHHLVRTEALRVENLKEDGNEEGEEGRGWRSRNYPLWEISLLKDGCQTQNVRVPTVNEAIGNCFQADYHEDPFSKNKWKWRW